MWYSGSVGLAEVTGSILREGFYTFFFTLKMLIKFQVSRLRYISLIKVSDRL